MLVAGVDGTKKGWVVVTFDGSEVDAFAAADVQTAFAKLADADFIAIDMPIGFRDRAEPGGRECERLARASLPGRTSSVFSSPCRAALLEVDYRRACEINRASVASGAGLSKQSHAIFPKMREVDRAMSPELQDRVFEVHPEVCFTELARSRGEVIATGKKTVAGSVQRTALLEAAGLAITPLRDRCRTYGAAEDDVLDAAVAAWTAHRRAQGLAFCLPAVPPVDARGLRMEMWV